MEKKRKKRFVPLVRRLIGNYFEHNVGKNAAALTYCLLFALFPMLIFLSNLLGLMDLNVDAVMQGMERFLPQDVVEIAGAYLDYVGHTSSHTLMWFSLIFTVWSPMRAAMGLMDDVRRAYGLGAPKNPVRYMIRQFVYTLVLLLVIVLTLGLSVLGERVLGFVNGLFAESVRLPEYLLRIWQYLRFVPAGVLMLAALGTLYALALDERQSVKSVLPGILLALVSWMVVSIAFSFYVNNSAQYSVIYGTLGAVIVLLMWLYMSALILIMGAEFNAALAWVRKEREEET